MSDSKELVPAVAGQLWSEVDSTFVPQLKKDMPIEQRREAVREVARKAIAAQGKLDLVAAELIYECQQGAYWKEWEFKDSAGTIRKFKNFDEYLEVELDFSKRKAHYLLAIYKKFVIELSLPKDVLREVEWSKAKELVGVIDGSNWQDLLEDIKDLTVVQVRELVERMKSATPATSTATKSPLVRIKFELHPEQAERVEMALEACKRMTGSEKTGHLLDTICADFLAGLIGEGAVEDLIGKLDYHIKNLENTFGVKLKIDTVDPSIVPSMKAADPVAV